MRCGRSKKQFYVFAKSSKFNNAWRDIYHCLLETTGHMPPRAEPIEETEKETHARLPTQTPASRVSKNPGGNKRQERMNAVSDREDKNRADKRVGKTTRQSKKESTRLWKKTTMRSQVTWKHQQPPPGIFLSLCQQLRWRSLVLDGTDNMQLSSLSRGYIHEGKTATVVTVSLKS